MEVIRGSLKQEVEERVRIQVCSYLLVDVAHEDVFVARNPNSRKP